MPSPAVSALLAWAEEFAAGMINDPAILDGTLAADERVAVRIGPVVEATLAIAPEPTVASSGQTGMLLATDQRVLLLVDGTVGQQWYWAEDVEMLVALREGLGVQWMPSPARVTEGAPNLEGLVVPGLVRGDRPSPEQVRVLAPEFMKVVAAWRTSQPGGLAGWVAEFRQRYAP